MRRAVPLLFLAVVAVALGHTPRADAQTLYVANQDAPLVSAVNAVNGALSTTIATGAGPIGVAVTADGSKVVVTNAETNSITIADTASGAIIGNVAVGTDPAGVAITPDGTTAYVANSGDNTVSVITLSTGNKAATVNTGLAPFGVAIAPNGGAVYVTNSFDNTVTVIRTAGTTVTATVPVGSSPSGIAVAADGNSVFVANSGDNTLSTIATQSNSVTGTRPTGAGPFGIAAAANGSVYVTNVVDGTVSVFGAGAPTSISVGGAPYGVAVDPTSTTVYVTNKATRSVQVVSAATAKVTSSFPVPGRPGSFGAFLGAGGPAISPLNAAILPDSRSVMNGATMTFAATVLNNSGTTLTNCRFTLPTSAPSGLTFLYQTLSASGALTGSPNTPTPIAANGAQNFLLAFSSATTVAPRRQPLTILCDNTVPAPDVIGLDLAGIWSAPVAISDVVSLAATPGNNGIVSAAVGSSSAFAVATANIGAADAALTAVADTQGLPLPVVATVCRTNASGVCAASPVPSLPVSFAAGENATFSVFVTFNGAVQFAPQTSRVFLRFIDANGRLHGSTSVAVRSP